MSSWKKRFFEHEGTQSNLKPKETESPIAKQVAVLLQCPVKELSSRKNRLRLIWKREEIWNEYQDALCRGKQQGFTPLLLICDHLLMETIEENLSEGQSHIEIPTKMDGKAFLDKQFAAHWEEVQSYGANMEEMLTEVESQPKGMHRFLSLNMAIGENVSILLTEIPTQNPWEALAWVPFGGWNECPMPEDCLAVLRYWYETYGAVPACIGCDTLELYVPKPVEDAKTAMELAKEQYAFCADVADQGVGSIAALAQEIQCSTVWYFWWD